ncbi:hypothetical protein ACFVH7_17865 [Kitasatospora indigofera]|uniref:hypothetical protein n=1 Tax=Kitasatospora indigofera TaxID=67307 RepID=UPI003628C88B
MLLSLLAQGMGDQRVRPLRAPQQASTVLARDLTQPRNDPLLAPAPGGQRCLTDSSLPLDVRIAGALVRLYGLHLNRIVHLTTDRFHQDRHGAYLTFGKHPVLLPPTLARLIEQQITSGRSRSALGTLATSEHPQLLLPGSPASRPRSPEALSVHLKKHGLPTIAARNTAMFSMAGELPPIILSDLFGLHRNTATQWAALAQDSWVGYLAALSSPDLDGDAGEHGVLE